MKQRIYATIILCVFILLSWLSAGFIANDFGLIPKSVDHRVKLVFVSCIAFSTYLGFITIETNLFRKK